MNGYTFNVGDTVVFADAEARAKQPDLYPAVGTKMIVKSLSEYGATMMIPGATRTLWVPYAYLEPVSVSGGTGKQEPDNKPEASCAKTEMNAKLLHAGQFPDWRKLK